jgi:membrane associated rhomboid family serine protease
VIPLSTDRPLRRPTLVNPALVIVNIVVYVAGSLFHQLQPEAFERVMEQVVMVPRELGRRPWTIVTYAFLHGGLLHLLGNMLFLWVFGGNVEDRLGRSGYLAFYLVGGVAAGGLHALYYPNPVIGASGAVAAVTGAYLVLFPRTLIRTLLFWFGVFEIPAWWFIGAQVAWNLLQEATGRTGGVATLAHLGGYAYGFGVGAVLLGTGLLKREVYDLFSITRQAARRREFREIEARRRRAAAQGRNPHASLKPKSVDEATGERIAAARGEVSLRLLEGDATGAGAAYRGLLEGYMAVPGAVLLSRESQYQLGNALYNAGDYATAARAYEVFLSGYPRDREAANVRLMLGVISARYLNDPVRAKREIGECLPGLDAEHAAIAREVLAELG